MTISSKTYTWDYANRLSSTVIGSLSTSYLYNHEGQRVYKTNASGTIASPYTFYETDSSTTTKHIYTPSGDLLSTIDKRGSTTTRSYAHTDHLGSTVAITSNTGAVSQVLEYYPYGGTRIDQKYGATNQRNRYIGQDSDIENSLIYLNARYYDGQRGQFLSQDPVFLGDAEAQDLKYPQNLNSYSYWTNNPIINKDPSGKATYVDVNGKRIIGSDTNDPNTYYEQDDINMLNTNANQMENNKLNAVEFYNKVNYGGEWDYKEGGREYYFFEGELVDKETYGNRHYGYTGSAGAFPGVVLKAGAGAASVRHNKGFVKNSSMYLDEQKDTRNIQMGIDAYQSKNSKNTVSLSTKLKNANTSLNYALEQAKKGNTYAATRAIKRAFNQLNN